MADETKKDDTAPTASPAEIVDAAKKGKNVKVEMPDGVSSISHDGVEYKAEDDGYFHMFIRHALHAVEAFGGRIVSEFKSKPQQPLKK
jgi:hypothetical protein